MKKILLCAMCLLASCGGGPDPIRLRQERAVHRLAGRAFDGWFQGLPFTEEDKRLSYEALGDWDASLKAEEALLAAPVGEVGR